MYRVTEVAGYIKPPYLIDWMVKKGKVEGEKIRDHAGDVGTAVDLYVQYDLISKDVIIPVLAGCKEEFDNCMAGWLEFKKAHPEFIKTAKEFKSNMQTELVDAELDLVGHPDFLFPTEVSDLKTSSGIKDEHKMQVSAYSRMAEAQLGYKITTNSIVWLSKKDAGVFKYERWGLDEIDYWFGCFMRRWDAMNEEKVYADLRRRQKEKEMLA